MDEPVMNGHDSKVRDGKLAQVKTGSKDPAPTRLPKAGTTPVEKCRHTVDICILDIEQHLATQLRLIVKLTNRLIPVLDNNVMHDAKDAKQGEFSTCDFKSPLGSQLVGLSCQVQARNEELSLLLTALDLPESTLTREKKHAVD